MPKTSIKLFALFKYPFQRRTVLLLFFSQCFILFLLLAAPAEASAIEEVSLGEIDLELCSSFVIWVGKIGSRKASGKLAKFSLSMLVALKVFSVWRAFELT